MPIIYKVTDIHLRSVFSSGYKVQYGVGKTVKPKRGTKGLFAFKRLKDADDFLWRFGNKQEYRVFLATASEAEKALGGIPSDVGLDWQVWWNKGVMPSSIKMKVTPEGSVICSDITLIKEVK